MQTAASRHGGAQSGGSRRLLRTGPAGMGGRELHLRVLLAAAVLLGGGGVGFALHNLVVQLIAIAALANLAAVRDFARIAPWPLKALVMASLTLPLLQCVPLPPALWQALPGRELVGQSLELVGRRDQWFPLSVDRNRTLVAALGLLPPIAVLVLAQGLAPERLRRVMALVVWLGLASLALGAVQLASGGTWGMLYADSGTGILHGTFANRNSAGLFLAICLAVQLALTPARAKTAGQWLNWLVAAALAAGVLLTQSRSATALLGLIFVARIAMAIAGGDAASGGRRAGRLALAVAGAIVLTAMAAALVSGSARIGATFARFALVDNVRPLVWEDALASARRFWPAGSGTGTFDEVFQVDETLEYLEEPRAGRAHNDYIELAIESGLPGLVLAAAWLVFLASHLRGASWSSDFGPRHGAALAIGLVLLQSGVDYPLRNEALLCVSALVVNIISRFTHKSEFQGDQCPGLGMNTGADHQ